MRIATIAALTFVTCPAFAYAAEPHPYTLAALDAFYGACMDASFDVETILPLIDTFGWDELPDALVNAMKPEAKQELFKGWMAKNRGEPPFPFALYIGKSDKSDPDPAEVCIAQFSRLDADEFVENFIDETEAKLLSEEIRGGDKHETFSLIDQPNVVIILSRSRRPGSQGLSATAVHLK